jgi:flagellar protein FlaJ
MNDENQPFLSRKWKEAEEYYAATGFNIKLSEFIALMFLLSLFSTLLAYTVTLFLPADSATSVILPFVAFVAMMSLVIGVPFHLRTTRIDKIEVALPDVLKHIAAVLKAGGTVESALEEVSESDYGPLSVDVERGLKQLREGRSIDEALIDMAGKSGSRLFVRIARVVVDSRKAGAGLAEVLESIAEDAREIMRIKRERVSRTTMHVAFLYITALFLVPFIFGFTLAIVKFIATGIAQTGTGTVSFGNFDLLLIVFLIIQVGISNIAVGIITEGKISNKLIYIPFMMLISLFVYQVGGFIGQQIIHGGI